MTGDGWCRLARRRFLFKCPSRVCVFRAAAVVMVDDERLASLFVVCLLVWFSLSLLLVSLFLSLFVCLSDHCVLTPVELVNYCLPRFFFFGLFPCDGGHDKVFSTV